MAIRILILGGGFGGVRAALDLSRLLRNRGSSIPSESGEKRNDVEITLVDKNDSQTFQPALYEIASLYGVDHEHPFHTKIRGAICIPYPEILKNKKINFVQAEIRHIDIQNKHVVTGNGATLDFDFIVLAFGSVASTFGVAGADEYAFKFKTIEDGLMLNDKIEELYSEAGKQNRPLPINILIGGAGFNGIELAAELSNCTAHTAHRHKITAQNCTTITLIEGGPSILPMIQERGREMILKRIKSLGINILVNSTIQEVGPDFVKLKDGSTLKGDLVVWTAGVKPLEIFKTVADLKLDERGRILVNEFLQTKNNPHVFAVGDNIIFVDPKTQKPIPQLAYLAMEQGRVVAKNIASLIFGKLSLKKYEPEYSAWIAPVGGKYAIAHVGKGYFSGFIGYMIREAADFRYFLMILPLFKAIKLFFTGIRVFSKND